MRASHYVALAAALLALAAMPSVSAGPLEDVADAVRGLPMVLDKVEDVDRRLASLGKAGDVISDVPLTLDGVDAAMDVPLDDLRSTTDVPVVPDSEAPAEETTTSEGENVPVSVEGVTTARTAGVKTVESEIRPTESDATEAVEMGSTETPEALKKAREQLQKTVDQVLKEAEQLARTADEDEYYDDEEGAAERDEAIQKARADLKYMVEQMLTDTEQQALQEALDDDGEEESDTNDISEKPPRSTEPTTQAETTRVDAEVPDDGAENSVQAALATTSESKPSTVPTPTTTSKSSTSTTPRRPMTTSEGSTAASPTTIESKTPVASSTTTASASTTTNTPSTTATWTTEKNQYQHLVVPLGEAEQNASVHIEKELEVTVPPGIPDDEDIIEAAVAAATAVHVNKQMSSSYCPTKQPAPLRLPALPNGAPDSDNPQCARDSRLLDLHIRNHTLWAVQMQDAGAAGITGLLEGNVYHLGDFDECMDVRGPVGTQYCVVEVHIHTPPRTPDHRHHPDLPADPMQSVWNRIKHEGEKWTLPLDTLHVALCAPSTCDARDLQDTVQRALDDHANCSNLPVAYTVTISEALCTSANKQRPPFSEGEIVYIVVVAVLVLMVMSGTLIDFFATKKKGLRWILVVFSLKRSWHMLTKADPRPMGLNLDPLSGARTINMVVLVIAHRGFNLMRGPVHNYNQYESIPRAMQQTVATHAQLFVDTCFALSGLLVALLELTRAHAYGKDSDSRAPLMAALVHRYVRLTPSYAMVVFFYATLFWRFGSGPLWDQVIGHESQACASYWWTNIFYVNNYINTDKLCMFQSWYLPVDLHLFFIGSALTLLLSRHRRTGLGFLVVFLGLSMLIPFLVTYFGNKPALLEMLPSLFRAPDQSNNFRTMYAPTHIRAAPYMVGLFAGYLFQRLALRHKERFTQGVTWLLCLGGVALTTASLLSSVVFYDPDMRYDGVVSGLYAALCPVVWSAGVCLVFASLVLGSRTIMSAILSWKPLVVLSRLTYNVYLTHWAFQVASVAKARAPYHLDPYNLFYLSFGDMMASLLISLILFLLVEAPFRSLARKITEAPPESKVHLQSAEEKEKSSALEAGFTGAIRKHN
ncbi:nose resistant to fluoxetine protein 6-like [Frankliniella occidentalis]|uniref:Nose resistant to fluoxetine protein 6-like n=1 Tax=Frankliniella occidentalis TaxID=133901 RepID=A0A6J1S845_FRAOC|nr:nose resistant to fluoxetine protein 6-like [Frankliniella occidentalis]